MSAVAPPVVLRTTSAVAEGPARAIVLRTSRVTLALNSITKPALAAIAAPLFPVATAVTFRRIPVVSASVMLTPTPAPPTPLAMQTLSRSTEPKYGEHAAVPFVVSTTIRSAIASL